MPPNRTLRDTGTPSQGLTLEQDTRDKVVRALTLLDSASLEQAKIDQKLEAHIRENDGKIQHLERDALLLDGKVDTLKVRVDALEGSIDEVAEKAVEKAVKAAIESAHIEALVKKAIEDEKKEAGWSASKVLLGSIVALLLAIGSILLNYVMDQVLEKAAEPPPPVARPAAPPTRSHR